LLANKKSYSWLFVHFSCTTIINFLIFNELTKYKKVQYISISILIGTALKEKDQRQI